MLGPRLFTITDRNSADATGETMVVLPMPLAAMVREHDHVNVEGTLEPLAAADFSPQWGWLRIESGVNATLARRPVLFTDRLIGEKNHQVLVDTSAVASRLVGSVESSEVKPLITTVDALASGTKRLVGGTVHLSNVTIDRSAGGKGFFITAGNTRVFVLPALMPPSAIAPGDTVSIDGVVSDMPRAMIDQSKVTANTDIYVYALGVRQ